MKNGLKRKMCLIARKIECGLRIREKLYFRIQRAGCTLTKARLETAHRVFAETVARNLGIEYDPKLELFRGRVYSAPEAVAAGYIDQMGSVHDAVVWVLGRAVATETSQLYR